MRTLTYRIRSGVAWFSRTSYFRRVGPTIMPPTEKGIAWLTHGRVQMSGLLVPSLVLHSTGAKSGLERDTPLMYCPDGRGNFLVTGSNFARDRHPAWTANLAANPKAAVTVRGRRVPVHAVRIPENELESTWALIERQWPGYRKYERTSGRALRIFRLEPVR